MISRRGFVCAGAAAICAVALPSPAPAQIIRKLTRMIVGYPPGGSTDVIARLLIDQMKFLKSRTV